MYPIPSLRYPADVITFPSVPPPPLERDPLPPSTHPLGALALRTSGVSVFVLLYY